MEFHKESKKTRMVQKNFSEKATLLIILLSSQNIYLVQKCSIGHQIIDFVNNSQVH